MYMSMCGMEHRPDVPVKPPQWVMKVLALVGRGLGYTLDHGAPRDGVWPEIPTRTVRRP